MYRQSAHNCCVTCCAAPAPWHLCCRAVAIAYDHSWEASSQSVLILSFTQVAVSKQKGLLQTTQASQLTANAQTATAVRIRKYALKCLAEAQANSQAPTQAPPDIEVDPGTNTQVTFALLCDKHTGVMQRPVQRFVPQVGYYSSRQLKPA